MRKIVVEHAPGASQDDWFYAELIDDHLEFGHGRLRASCMGSWGFIMQVIGNDWGVEAFGCKKARRCALKGEAR